MQDVSEVFKAHKGDSILFPNKANERILDYKPIVHSKELLNKTIVIESNASSGKATSEIKKEIEVNYECLNIENDLKAVEKHFSKLVSTKIALSALQSNYLTCPIKQYDNETEKNGLQTSLEKKFNHKPKKKVSNITTKMNSNMKKVSAVDSSQNFSNAVSCRFCRKSFKSVVNCKRHTCNQSKKKGSNSCQICSVELTSRKALCKHLKKEHNVNEPLYLYNCSYCDRAFGKQASLNSHLKTHGEGKFVCIKCGFMCLVKEEYSDHMKEHEKPIKFECPLCNKQFVRKQQFDQHMMLHKQHFCSSCNASFSTKKMLIQHQHSHHGLNVIKKYECPICKKSFIRPFHLKVHLQCHTGEKPVKCYQCNKNFANQQSFKKHMKSAMHLKKCDNVTSVELEKTFLCSICGSKFFRLQTLRRHIETIHLTGEVYKCPHCDYNTKFKANFVRHKEGHFNIKRYVCEICGASFRALGTLQEHQIFVHSDSRNFACDTCGKAFKNKSTLQRHLRVHKDERPYKCHCNLSYKRLSHLKRHLASAHGIAPEKGLNKISIINKDSSTTNAPLEDSQCSTTYMAELDSQDENSLGIDFPGCIEQTVPLTKSSGEEKINEHISCPNNVPNLLEEITSAPEFVSSKKRLPSLSELISDTQDSIASENQSLIVSDNTCNLQTSPQKLKHSLDKAIRPQSLPNLNFQASHDETYFPIPMDHMDFSSSNPPFSTLDKEPLMSAHNNLFEDITNFNLTSESENVECSSDIFFNVSKNSDFWGPKSSKLSNVFGNFELSEDNYSKIPSTISEFSSNYPSNYSPLLACNLVFPDDPLMECTIDTDSFNTDDFVLQ